MSLRRLAAAGLGALLSILPAATGWAWWTGAGSGTGSSSTATLAAPTAVHLTKPAATTVRVTWPASPAPDGGPVTGYHVTRLAGSTPAAACGTSPTALLTATTCDDTGLAAGTYTYAVTAVFRTWTATAASASSIGITAGEAGPSVSSIVRAGGAPAPTSTNDTLQWTVTFTAPVTGVGTSDFALVAGPGLGGSPTVTTVAGSGAAYTVTASTGSGSGTLGLNLVDDDSVTDAGGNRLGGTGAGNGNYAGATYTLDRTIASVALVNGGTAGVIDSGDQIVIRFSRAMRSSTICGSWSDQHGMLVDLNAPTGGTRVTATVSGNGFGGGSGNDVLTLTAGNCLNGMRFGSIDLGSPGYVNGPRNFAASAVSYNPDTFTLTVRLGQSDSGGGHGSVTSASPRYTADPGITDSNGLPVNNSPFGLSSQMWF